MSRIELPLLYSGKVRDVYDAGDDRMLLVASDRLSAFDVVMTEPVPDKGRVLTAISVFWFERLGEIAPHHLLSADPADFGPGVPGELGGRAMLVRRAEMLPIECIVRGHLSGSAWKEYQASGTVHGTEMTPGLKEASRLDEPIFTPSTKAADGDHDENISFEDAADLIGHDLAEEARRLSLELFHLGAELAAERGILIADTKFELGMIDGRLAVADEVLTPDSSRFWPAESWEPGSTPPSFDKQPVRDFLDTLEWDKRPPAPSLPDHVIAATTERYREAYGRLTSLDLDDWHHSGSPRG